MVYLSNEDPTYNEVYFDDLKITLNEHPVIQMDDYYPFGLTHSGGFKRVSNLKNDFKYNGFEEQTELDWGVYDYQARYYDPQTGRFLQVDPAADLMRRHSIYNYAFDNPIRFIDPDGMMPEECENCKSQVTTSQVVEVNSVKPIKSEFSSGNIYQVDFLLTNTTQTDIVDEDGNVVESSIEKTTSEERVFLKSDGTVTDHTGETNQNLNDTDFGGKEAIKSSQRIIDNGCTACKLESENVTSKVSKLDNTSVDTLLGVLPDKTTTTERFVGWLGTLLSEKQKKNRLAAGGPNRGDSPRIQKLKEIRESRKDSTNQRRRRLDSIKNTQPIPVRVWWK